MKRVMIVGGPGSGKSTLARTIGARTGLPVYHMDLIHWQENWVERPRPQRWKLAAEIETRDRWVFEGGLSRTYDSRLARADVLIWLDLPVGLRLWRVTKRLFRYLGQNRPDLPQGCAERIHPETWAFYRFIWTHRHRSRDKIVQLIERHEGAAQIIHLRRPDEVAAYVAQLPVAQSR
jgi:adenylate kinase family enzyme